MLAISKRKIKEEVARLIRLAEEADTEDIPDGMDIPEELNRREMRLKAVS
ncbi:hypothetical protein MASR1M12_03920 [Erysipelotrichia bacterium]